MSAHHGNERRAAVAVLTVSDTRTPENDLTGRTAQELTEAAGHRVVERSLLPDDPEAVRAWAERMLARDDCDALLICGGTGISARDRTYEAVSGLLEQTLPGFGELFRMLSHAEVGSVAMLSRAVGGVAGGKPLFALPGSPAAVRLGLGELVLPALGHLLAELRKHA